MSNNDPIADMRQSVPETANDTLTLKLRELSPALRYEVENFDGGREVHTGRELMDGYAITLRGKPAAALLRLKAIQ